MSYAGLILLIIRQFGLQLFDSGFDVVFTRGQCNPKVAKSLHDIHTQHQTFWFRSSLLRILCLGLLFLASEEIIVIKFFFRRKLCETCIFNCSCGWGRRETGSWGFGNGSRTFSATEETEQLKD